MEGLGPVGGIAAGIAAIVAGVLLILFFATRDDRLGRANDAGLAITAVLLLPFALALNDRFEGTGLLVPGVTIVGIGALVATAVGSTLTAAGRLNAQQLVAWQGGSFVAMFAWVLSMSLAILWSGRLPAPPAWVGIGSAALLVVAIVSLALLARRLGGWSALGEMDRPPGVAIVAMALAALGLPIWSIWLGLELLGGG